MKQMWSEEEIEKLSKETTKDITTLVDSAGNPRFVEGDGVGLEQEGITISYCKWSLSGTHLMFVVAGSVANTTVISNNTTFAGFVLPNFIKDKIYVVWANNAIEYKKATLYADNWSSQDLGFTLIKGANLEIRSAGSLTLTGDRSFRVQFDLLIDTE